jgi:hypothetical protein
LVAVIVQVCPPPVAVIVTVLPETEQTVGVEVEIVTAPVPLPPDVVGVNVAPSPAFVGTEALLITSVVCVASTGVTTAVSVAGP